MLNLTEITPELSGRTASFGHSGIVHPHVDLASVIRRGAVPVLVNANSLVTTSPSLTVPKSNRVSLKVMIGRKLLSIEPSGRTGLWTRSARFPEGLNEGSGVLDGETSCLHATIQIVATRIEKVINRLTSQIYYF